VSSTGAGDSTRPPQLENSARPLVSMEGFARFEQRARQRRIEKRLSAARAAISARRFRDADAALAEVRELDALHPELAPLEQDLLAARAKPPVRVAPAAVATAAFTGIMLAASWLGTSSFLQSYPMLPVSALAPVPEAALTAAELPADAPAEALADSPALETRLGDATVAEVPPAARAVPRVVAEPPAAAPVTVPPIVATTGLVDLPVSTAAAVIPAILPPPSTALPAAAIEPAVVRANETDQVRATLRRYQTAYDRLDARMAHAVWPGVDEAALARAFNSLESQTLQFDDCDVQLRGSTAAATCRGSARYVPKIGSREPRTESRVWTFTLRKLATDWQIETARADR
jgi:hypothetical protein